MGVKKQKDSRFFKFREGDPILKDQRYIDLKAKVTNTNFYKKRLQESIESKEQKIANLQRELEEYTAPDVDTTRFERDCQQLLDEIAPDRAKTKVDPLKYEYQLEAFKPIKSYLKNAMNDLYSSKVKTRQTLKAIEQKRNSLREEVDNLKYHYEQRMKDRQDFELEKERSSQIKYKLLKVMTLLGRDTRENHLNDFIQELCSLQSNSVYEDSKKETLARANQMIYRIEKEQ
eukprot:NODE_530_length_6411_cov_0.882288.p4 type:complete len:231 gc:universal NODE_530_length_6411_cov_0.882288:5040-5732(+)